MTRFSRGLILAALALTLPSALWGQAKDYNALRDSLAAIEDVAALRRMLSGMPMPGQVREADALIVRGLVALRVHELTGLREDSEAAVGVFERGAERFPDEVWLQYGLGLALATAPEIRVGGGALQGVTLGQSVAEILGRDPRSKARRALRRALDLEPSLGGAAVLMAELAVAEGRDRDALMEASGLLAGVRAAGNDSADVLRATAEVETALGNYGAAVVASGAAGRGAEALLARAVALLLQPGSAETGAAEYLAAVDVMERSHADRFYSDVELIVQPAEAADWEIADVAGRRQWLRRFWERRAAEAGILLSERLAEHYGRLAIARRSYLRNSRRSADGPGMMLGEAVPESSPFDDRGVILVRRGVPNTVVSTTQDGVLPNETWVYTEPGSGSNTLFHFVSVRGSRDFSLVTDLLQAVDPTYLSANERGAVDASLPGAFSRGNEAIVRLLEDRAAYEPEYQSAVGRIRVLLAQGYAPGGTEIRSAIERVDADYRQEARRALATDVHHANFEHDVEFHHALFAFRTPFGRTDLTAAFAVKAGDLASVEGAGGSTLYPMMLSVILIDTLSDEVVRQDTLHRIAYPLPLAADEYVRAHVSIPVVASEHTVYRVGVRSPAIRAGALRSGGTRIRGFGGVGVELSDLVLAAPDSAGDWSRGETRLALTLPRRYPPGRPFTLFYEVYNLAEDTPYRTHLQVESANGGGLWSRIKGLFGSGAKIDVRYEDIAAPDADGVIQETRRVDTGLPPGRYRMRVLIENVVTGESAESVAEFEVIG